MWWKRSCSSPRPHPARTAAEEGPRRHPDPRLQAQRHHHAVRRARCPHRRGVRTEYAAPSASGIHPLPPRPRARHPARQAGPRHPRQLRRPQALKRGFAEDYVLIFGGNGETGTTASRSCAVVAYQNSGPRLPPVRRRGSGACQDIRRSNMPCAISTSTRSVFSDSMSLSKRNPVEPPWYVTRMPDGVGGAAA